MRLSRTPITVIATFALLLFLNPPQLARGLGPATGPPECEVDADCNDGNLCTDDVCNSNTGVCSNDWIDCDDNNGCTYDYCDPGYGCYHDPVNTDDGNECTVDGCDPETGATNDPIDCDDGDPCTNNDCDPQEGCVNSPVDCQGELPDGCDCNEDQVNDLCELNDGTSHDYNGNSVLDQCDIAAGVSEDCNTNGIPDECEVTTSPQFSPFGRDSWWYFTFVNPPVAEGNVTLAFSAIGDLGDDNERVLVRLNGNSLPGYIFESNGSDCPDQPDSAEIVLSAATFNALVGSGHAEVAMLATWAVNADECNPASFISVALLYEPGMPDQNANGIPDQCECLGDLNGDWVVTAMDLAELLGSWGPCPGCPADFDGDGAVNAFDLAILLGAWGPCP